MDNETTAAFAAIGDAMREVNATILVGWPFEDLPTDEEAHRIESAYHELCLAEPHLGDRRSWYLAGQIVARMRRDLRSAT